MAPLTLVCLLIGSPSHASDWVTAPSFYTHDQSTGLRTHQHTPTPAATVKQPSSFQTSGFRHFRSTLQYGRSADNYHRVEQWGPPVRPYGEWRFPYRPYSVPYDQWGAPYAGFNFGLGAGLGGFPVPLNRDRSGQGGRDYARDPRSGNRYGGYGDGGYGDGGYGAGGYGAGGYGDAQQPNYGRPYPYYPPFPSEPYPSGPGFLYPVPPYADGYYPDDAARPRLNDREFFRKPTQGPSN